MGGGENSETFYNCNGLPLLPVHKLNSLISYRSFAYPFCKVYPDNFEAKLIDLFYNYVYTYDYHAFYVLLWRGGGLPSSCRPIASVLNQLSCASYSQELKILPDLINPPLSHRYPMGVFILFSPSLARRSPFKNFIYARHIKCCSQLCHSFIVNILVYYPPLYVHDYIIYVIFSYQILLLVCTQCTII